MKAIVIHQARHLRIEKWASEEPGPEQVRIRTAVGGVCGSNLHYYNHGGFGSVQLREPMVLATKSPATSPNAVRASTGFRKATSPRSLRRTPLRRPAACDLVCAKRLKTIGFYMTGLNTNSGTTTAH